MKMVHSLMSKCEAVRGTFPKTKKRKKGTKKVPTQSKQNPEPKLDFQVHNCQALKKPNSK